MSRIDLPTDYEARKKWQLWTFLTTYFPDSFLAVVDVAIKGNDQHNPGEPLHWARGKSMDQMNTAMRHLWDHSAGGKVKDSDGCYHLAKAIWRLSAELQLLIEGDNELSKTEEKDAGSVAEAQRCPDCGARGFSVGCGFRAIEADADNRWPTNYTKPESYRT